MVAKINKSGGEVVMEQEKAAVKKRLTLFVALTFAIGSCVCN
jgi:hypothetical protein